MSLRTSHKYSELRLPPCSRVSFVVDVGALWMTCPTVDLFPQISALRAALPGTVFYSSSWAYGTHFSRIYF